MSRTMRWPCRSGWRSPSPRSDTPRLRRARPVFALQVGGTGHRGLERSIGTPTDHYQPAAVTCVQIFWHFRVALRTLITDTSRPTFLRMTIQLVSSLIDRGVKSVTTIGQPARSTATDRSCNAGAGSPRSAMAASGQTNPTEFRVPHSTLPAPCRRRPPVLTIKLRPLRLRQRRARHSPL